MRQYTHSKKKINKAASALAQSPKKQVNNVKSIITPFSKPKDTNPTTKTYYKAKIFK